jgi:hypothetical protein
MSGQIRQDKKPFKKLFYAGGMVYYIQFQLRHFLLDIFLKIPLHTIIELILIIFRDTYMVLYKIP